MIQPRLRNRREYKVILLNGKYKYSTGPSKGKAFSVPPHRDLISFAERAVQTLSHHHAGAICDGLIRVDVMQTFTGDMIVNEFESLEADYTSKRNAETLLTDNFLTEYWKQVLTDIVAILHSKLSK
jgi:hypothetical protein